MSNNKKPYNISVSNLTDMFGELLTSYPTKSSYFTLQNYRKKNSNFFFNFLFNDLIIATLDFVQ